MVNFCPKCGQKSNLDNRFCKNCGANLIESNEVPKPIPTQTPSVPPEPPTFILIIRAIIQIGILGLFLYWVWYCYGCAVGKYVNNGDQMCQSIYQMFKGGGDDDGGDGCIPTGCSSYLPWNGCGKCWLDSNTCHTRGTSNSSDDCSVCRKCP